VDNRNKDSNFYGPYAGRDMNVTNIIMLQDSEREFVVTHNADIKPVSYFTGRETELEELRQRIDEGRKSVLVSGMGGIGKTHICRKLFEEYTNKHAKGENIPFCHIGYIEYNGDMGSSLQNCLKFKEQDNPEQNQAAAWKELEYLAADGKLLLFVDNVNVSVREDAGLERLKQIPGAVVLTSRRTSFGKEFEPYRIGFLSTEQCIMVYEKIRYENSSKKVPEEEILDLEYIIENMAAGHTITIEFFAHLAETKQWSIKRLREELDSKGFRLEYKDEEDKLINIQEEYEKLYDLSVLTEAEGNILEAFSVFPYIPLSAEICNQWLLFDAGASEDDDILMGLYQKGWLQFDVEQESYAMHPVFAKFIDERKKPKFEEHRGLIEVCQKCLEIPENGSALDCQRYIPFAENIIKKIDMKSSIKEARFITELAYLLQYIAEHEKAEELYEKSLRIQERVLGEEHSDTVAIYNNLAYVYNCQGEYKRSKELYEKSLWIREKVFGEKHPAMAYDYNNLAMMYERQGRYRESEDSVVDNMENEGSARKRERRRKGNIFGNVLSIISLVISLLSLLISYRTIQLEEVEYQPHFICTTKNNEEYKKPESFYFKIHTIKNIGVPISNVEFDIQEVLCFQRALTSESMDVLIWKKTDILNEDKDIKYDLDKQEIVIEGIRLEYIEYMLNSYFNSDSNIFFYEPYRIKVYNVTCKRILNIQYTNREGVNCRECYELKENHISLLDKIVKREDYNEIVDFIHGSKYELGEVYQDNMEQAQDMITNMLGINIEREKEELAKQYNKKD